MACQGCETRDVTRLVCEDCVRARLKEVKSRLQELDALVTDLRGRVAAALTAWPSSGKPLLRAAAVRPGADAAARPPPRHAPPSSPQQPRRRMVTAVQAAASTAHRVAPPLDTVQVGSMLSSVRTDHRRAVADARVVFGADTLAILARTRSAGYTRGVTDMLKYCMALAPQDGAIFIGEVARITARVASRLAVQLRYPLSPDGPRSAVCCVSPSGVVEWLPLRPEASGDFHRALNMLAHDAAQVVTAMGVPCHPDNALHKMWQCVAPATAALSGTPLASPRSTLGSGSGSGSGSDWNLI